MNPDNQPTPIQPAEGGERCEHVFALTDTTFHSVCCKCGLFELSFVKAQLDAALCQVHGTDRAYENLCHELHAIVGVPALNETLSGLVRKQLDAARAERDKLIAGIGDNLNCGACAEAAFCGSINANISHAPDCVYTERDELRQKLAEAEKNRGAAIASMNELSKFALAKEQKDAQTIDQLRAELQEIHGVLLHGDDRLSYEYQRELRIRLAELLNGGGQ